MPAERLNRNSLECFSQTNRFIQLQRVYKLQLFVHSQMKRNSVSCVQNFVRPINQDQNTTLNEH